MTETFKSIIAELEKEKERHKNNRNIDYVEEAYKHAQKMVEDACNKYKAKNCNCPSCSQINKIEKELGLI